MAQQQQHSVGTKIKDYEPDLYDVIFINDDFTTMDFVVKVLREVFFHDTASATKIMLAVHHYGSCIVGTYTFDIAKSKQMKANDMAQQEGFPLRINIQLHK